MAFPSVTYTFVNNTTADATQVNQNFTDIVNGISDGTKSINISAITAASTATLNGNITLGASAANTVSVLAGLISNVPVNANATYDLGGTSLGFRSLYFGGSGGGGFTIRFLGPALSASYTVTLPTTVGTNRYAFQTDGTGVASWGVGPNAVLYTVKTANYTMAITDDVILANANSGIFTVTFPDATTATLAGKKFIVKKTDNSANIVTVATTSAQTIDGSTTISLVYQYDEIEVHSDGSNWQVIQRFKNPGAYIIGSSTGTTTWLSSTFTAVTNLSASINVPGDRNILLAIVSDGSGSSCQLGVGDSLQGVVGQLRFMRDSTEIGRYTCQVTAVGSTSTQIFIPGAITHVDLTPAVGLHAYTVQVQVTAGTAATFTVKNMKLVAIPL